MNPIGKALQPAHRPAFALTAWRDGRIPLIFLVLLALIPRLWYLGADLVLIDDELHYAESISHFLRGDLRGGLSDYWSFFYPLAAVPLAWLVGDGELGLRLLSVLAGAAAVAPVFLLARRLWGATAAWFAGLLVALHPMLCLFSAQAMTESFYSGLLLTAIVLLVFALEDGSFRRSALAGLLLALAWLTRPEAQFVLPVFVVFLRAVGAGGRSTAPRRLRAAALLVAVFVVTITPFLFLLHAKTGRWTAGSKASVNISSPLLWQNGLAKEEYLYRLNPEGTRRALDDVKTVSPLRVLWQNRRNVAARYPENVSAGLGLMPTLLASPFLILLVPIGLFGRRWRQEHRAAELLLLLLGLFPLALFSFFTIDHRYFVSYLPIYLLWAGAGGVRFLEWWKESISPRSRPAWVILGCVWLSLLPYLGHKRATLAAGQPRAYRSIGRWIHDQVPPAGGPERILAPSGCSISYYAGRPEATYLPWTDPEGLLRFARSHRYTLLVAPEGYLRERRPALAGLAGPAGSPPPAGFTEIARLPGPDGLPITLYRIGL